MSSLLPLATFTTTRTPPNSTSNSPSKTFRPKQTHRLKVSCNVAPDDNEKLLEEPENRKLILPKTSLDSLNVDRRNLLLGLGGLYSTFNFTSVPAASAEPITVPDISTCVAADEGLTDPTDPLRGTNCCPPASSTGVKEFVFPTDTTIRVRPPAHRATAEYVAKYKAALKAMRDLPDDHPHSFVQQARIHCAYCNGGYTQIASGYPDKELQVHNSWLFFPFHRWYLYFFERILGKLINDPTFALPYWNWDNPGGMTIPVMFNDDSNGNPAYDVYRNADHVYPAIVDLDYSGTDSGIPAPEQININLTTMYKQMISNAGDSLMFFGGVFRAGDDPYAIGDPSVGSVEAGCHTAGHRWVGDGNMPNQEDMGNFYSAAYDPVFYSHHANIDRMWKVWKDLGIIGHTEPTDSDWLNASYLFYDENKELVRVYNKDCVKMENLKYDYEFSPLPWRHSRPVPRNRRLKVAKKSTGKVKKVEDVKFPLELDGIRKVLVKRPAVNRSETEKEKENEVLFINGIKFNGTKFVKFDVFVNDPDEVPGSSAAESEFAGSFAQVPHRHKDEMLMRSGVRFGLTELLEDIDAEGDKFILVTLVPKTGSEEVTIGEIKVELVPYV